MSVTQANLILSGNSYSDNESGIRTFTDVYQIHTSSSDDGGATVAASQLVPQLYSPHAEDFGCTVRERTFERVEQRIWTASIQYSNETQSSDSQNEAIELEPPKRRWRTEKVLMPLIEDLDGDPVINKAGVPFENPIEVQRSFATLEITRNEVGFSGAAALQFVDRVNSSPMAGAAAGTLRLEDISAEESIKSGMAYWVVTYVFAYNPNGWQPKVLNAGMMKASTNGQKYVRLKDENGEDLTEPVPLDNNGEPVQPDQLPGAAVMLEFKGYETANFASLGLPI